MGFGWSSHDYRQMLKGVIVRLVKPNSWSQEDSIWLEIKEMIFLTLLRDFFVQLMETGPKFSEQLR